MTIFNILSTLRRSGPSVVQCFKNVQLYRSEAVAQQSERELVILFTWLGAKQKYAHKYANCWLHRGHDVLHVTTSVSDLLFPKTGAEVTANRVVDFMDHQKANVIVHGLSVGGYLTQRVIIQAQDSVTNITHQIYDSFTSWTGLEAGVENAVSPKYRNAAKFGSKIYLKFADLSSVKEATHFASTSPNKAPSMFIHSLADKVALYSELQCIIRAHQKAGPVTTYLIPEQRRVPHVAIMRHIGETKYTALVNNFIDNHRDLIYMDQDYSQSASLEFLEDDTSTSRERMGNLQ